MGDYIVNRWTVGEYAIDEVPNWTKGEPNLFRFTIGDAKPSGTYYHSLDMALAEAISAKYVGEAMVGGPGIATAAVWFARMIGMDH